MDLCLCLSKTANHMIVHEKFDRGHQMQVVSTFCTTHFRKFRHSDSRASCYSNANADMFTVLSVLF